LHFSLRLVYHAGMDDYEDYAEPITAVEEQLKAREQAMDFQLTQMASIKRPFVLPRTGATREQIKDTFNTAFELIGGVPRLAIWANDNPDKFYSLWARLQGNSSQPTTPAKMIVEHVLRRNRLDEVTIDEQGRVLDVPSTPTGEQE